jgi:hypothetical protein
MSRYKRDRRTYKYMRAAGVRPRADKCGGCGKDQCCIYGGGLLGFWRCTNDLSKCPGAVR